MSEKNDRPARDYEEWGMKNWRAWGSWFSWGSPVGLGLFYALVAIPTGVLIWLIHHR
jgi:hypothetical protein